MLGLFSRETKILAPVGGRCVALTTVPDEVFSTRMMGDGVAIIPAEGLFVAPADGELTMLFQTGHAFGMRLGKTVEILVHIGLNTVELEGRGFEILAKQGQTVTAGTPIVRVDLNYLQQMGYPIITPIIVTAPDTGSSRGKNRVKPVINADVRAGFDLIMTVKT